MFLIGFPLLLIPFAIYNIIAFLTPGVGWTTPVTTVHMMSGAGLGAELGGFAPRLFDSSACRRDHQIDADRAMRAIVDHVLAMALFIVMLVEFLLVQQAGTSTFFLLTMIAPGRRAGRLHRQHPQLAAPGRSRSRRAGVRRTGIAAPAAEFRANVPAHGVSDQAAGRCTR